jgi:hypothetical protein
MEKIIPLPTDNIYKFYALFGLLTIIFCISATIYINHSTNELVFASTIEYEALKTIEKPTSVEAARIKVIEKKVEMALSDKQFFKYSISILLGLALFAMCYGFWKWHREVQPIQDEILRLQLEKLRKELQNLSPEK